MSYLVADIGATNARFAFCDDNGPVGDAVVLSTRSAVSALDLLKEALALSTHEVTDICLAVAGPCANNRAAITNGSLHFDGDQLGSELGAACTIVNDFVGYAHGVPHFQQLHQLGGSAPLAGACKALVGPGSGCGMSVLLPRGGGWLVMPSEGGHADLPASNPLEAELVTALQATHESVCWETVLSGPGLQHLYAAMCQVWGSKPETLNPEEITRRAIGAEDPVCHQTVETFVDWLAAAASNLAVTTIAKGGVYIGGGIVQQLGDGLSEKRFRRRFEARGAMSAWVADIPVYVVLDAYPGLLGAYHCLQSVRNGYGP